MGLSSKKTKTTSNSTSTIAPSDYSKPYIDDAASTIKPAYEQSYATAQGFIPQLNKSAEYYGDVQSGKFLDSNPYIDQIVSDSNADITDSVNQSFMPRFGSGYHAKALAKQLGANEALLRGGNYATERGYQDAAGGKLAGLATTATALPMIPAQGYTDAIGGLMGRYVKGDQSGTSTTKQSGGFFGDLLLAMAANAGKFGGGG